MYGEFSTGRLTIGVRLIRCAIVGFTTKCVPHRRNALRLWLPQDVPQRTQMATRVTTSSTVWFPLVVWRAGVTEVHTDKSIALFGSTTHTLLICLVTFTTITVDV